MPTFLRLETEVRMMKRWRVIERAAWAEAVSPVDTVHSDCQFGINLLE